ncbi:MAG: hypothetical protein ACR2J5_09770 [Geodermatophilaceae bacterium]
MGVVAALALSVSLSVSAPSIADANSTRSAGQSTIDADAEARQVRQAQSGLPLSFEANDGQASSDVDFLARSGDSTLYVTREGAMLSRGGASDAPVGMDAVGPRRLPTSPRV